MLEVSKETVFGLSSLLIVFWKFDIKFDSVCDFMVSW